MSPAIQNRVISWKARWLTERMDNARRNTKGVHDNRTINNLGFEPLREQMKERLLNDFPAMRSGTHWELLIEPEWLPLCVFDATVSSNELAKPGSEDLRICNVIWQCDGGPLGLSFYNNYQNLKGVMNLNFGLASQYLVELGQRTYPTGFGKSLSQAQVSVRAGNHIGNLEKKYDSWELNIMDFSTMTYDVFKRKHEASHGTAPPATSEWENLMRMKFETCKKSRSTAHLEAQLLTGQRWKVPLDDFVITVIDIPPKLTPQEIFSGIFGMIPPSRSWTIRVLPPSTPLVQFYLPNREAGHDLQPQFFHQDRLSFYSFAYGPGSSAYTEEEEIIRALGHTPIRVPPHVRKFLIQSTTFPEITDYANGLLLGAPLVSEAASVAGYDRFQRAVLAMTSGLREKDISMRRHTPQDAKVVWSLFGRCQMVAILEPEPCAKHTGQQCICWVVMYVYLAAKEYPCGQRVFGKMDRPWVEKLASHSACMDCVEVDLKLREVADARDDDVVEGHVCLRRRMVVGDDKLTKEADHAHISSQPPLTQSTPSSQRISNAPMPSSSSHSAPMPRPSAPAPGTSLAGNIRTAGAGSASSNELCLTKLTDVTAPTRSERSIEPYKDSPDEMSIDELLEYCNGLIKRRSIKDRTQVSAELSALRAKETRLGSELAQQRRTEEQLRATVDQRKDKSAAHEAQIQAKNSQLQEKDTRISVLEASLRDNDSRVEELEGTLRIRNTRIDEIEARLKRLEGQLQEKEQVARVKRLLDGTPPNLNKEGNPKESLPEDTGSPRKRLRADTDTR
ncbi:hypothetical protein CERSUDRAFT_97006 [Gelatoporia subvermispora B]|uniref:Uncharacterized protein n=1 Tax=Ceriporiopsis subvermispora (strain B) TaxID=914234 RepID=M2QDH7_CERS8|nr:hypothetical protein CERSUDRAFT_97006 [Gelatoporia subvermispora B]